jgi:outer membrane lipoprotein-sorting protein
MRTLLAASLLTLLSAAPPVGGQEANDAEKLFRKMEETLTKAKTLQVSTEVIMKALGEEVILVGPFRLAEGDRLNLTLVSTVAGKKRKGTFISDGKRIERAVDGPPKDSRPTPPGLTRYCAGKFARAGIGFSFLLAVQDEGERAKARNIDEWYPVSGFRLGKREKVGGRTAQIIEHKLTWAGKEPVFHATVWLDVKTNLPLKRILTSTKDGLTIRFTEVYTDLILDAKLDSKLFDLPK